MHDDALAIIGCGAIADFAYLPALAASSEWRSATWLVDPNPARLASVAETYGFSRDQLAARIEDLPPSVRLAINATPSHLHFATTIELVSRDIDVIVEKPFAEKAADARAMIAAATGRSLLTVNQSRRAHPSNVLVRALIGAGNLGEIRSVTWHEGHKFDWPTQSGFNFRRPWHGRARGVTLDIGVHVLDLICWWLRGQPNLVEARIDGQGGPEASLRAQLSLRSATIDVRLSYLVKLSNQFLIEGTKGIIRGSTSDIDVIEFRPISGGWRTMRATGRSTPTRAAARLISNVLAARAGQEPLMIDAASTIPPLDVIDRIYEEALPDLPACYSEFVDPGSGATARTEVAA